MPDFSVGPRKSRGRLEAESNPISTQETNTGQNRELGTDAEADKMASQWEDYRAAMVASGALDAQGRWVKAEGLSAEQRKYLLKLQSEKNSNSESVIEEVAPIAVIEGARDNFEPDVEIGSLHNLDIDGAPEAFSYQGDDSDGKALLVTQKGLRLLKSRGLDEVKKMGEIYPNEFFRAVDKEILQDQKRAA